MKKEEMATYDEAFVLYEDFGVGVFQLAKEPHRVGGGGRCVPGANVD